MSNRQQYAQNKIVIGQVGLGGWGPNLLRNLLGLDDCRVKYCCDLDDKALSKVKTTYPQINLTKDYTSLLNDKELAAVVIATPSPSHFPLVKQALEAGKHVYVEKPLALRIDDAEQMIALAKKVERKLMVGHLLLYHPAIRKLRQLINDGELGEIYYVYTQRLNLGTIRNTENVMWSLAPHDISVVLHLIKGKVAEVSARGSAFIQREIEDVVFLNIKFANGEIGNVHVSWLDPTKTRRTIVVGSKKMAIFDEMSARDTLTIVDKGVDLRPQFKDFREFLNLRFGEVKTIDLEKQEPLKLECQHFLDCLKCDQEPLSNGENGLAVLRVLAAAHRSLKGGQSELL